MALFGSSITVIEQTVTSCLLRSALNDADNSSLKVVFETPDAAPGHVHWHCF